MLTRATIAIALTLFVASLAPWPGEKPVRGQGTSCTELPMSDGASMYVDVPVGTYRSFSSDSGNIYLLGFTSYDETDTPITSHTYAQPMRLPRKPVDMRLYGGSGVVGSYIRFDFQASGGDDVLTFCLPAGELPPSPTPSPVTPEPPPIPCDEGCFVLDATQVSTPYGTRYVIEFPPDIISEYGLDVYSSPTSSCLISGPVHVLGLASWRVRTVRSANGAFAAIGNSNQPGCGMSIHAGEVGWTVFPTGRRTIHSAQDFAVEFCPSSLGSNPTPCHHDFFDDDGCFTVDSEEVNGRQQVVFNHQNPPIFASNFLAREDPQLYPYDTHVFSQQPPLGNWWIKLTSGANGEPIYSRFASGNVNPRRQIHSGVGGDWEQITDLIGRLWSVHRTTNEPFSAKICQLPTLGDDYCETPDFNDGCSWFWMDPSMHTTVVASYEATITHICSDDPSSEVEVRLGTSPTGPVDLVIPYQDSGFIGGASPLVTMTLSVDSDGSPVMFKICPLVSVIGDEPIIHPIPSPSATATGTMTVTTTPEPTLTPCPTPGLPCTIWDTYTVPVDGTVSIPLVTDQIFAVREGPVSLHCPATGSQQTLLPGLHTWSDSDCTVSVYSPSPSGAFIDTCPTGGAQPLPTENPGGSGGGTINVTVNVPTIEVPTVVIHNTVVVDLNQTVNVDVDVTTHVDVDLEVTTNVDLGVTFNPTIILPTPGPYDTPVSGAPTAPLVGRQEAWDTAQVAFGGREPFHGANGLLGVVEQVATSVEGWTNPPGASGATKFNPAQSFDRTTCIDDFPYDFGERWTEGFAEGFCIFLEISAPIRYGTRIISFVIIVFLFLMYLYRRWLSIGGDTGGTGGSSAGKLNTLDE